MASDLSEVEKQELLKKTAVISLSTVSLMIKIIDISSKRGSYHANELTTVGSLYDHLSQGMQQMIKQYKDEKKQTENTKADNKMLKQTLETLSTVKEVDETEEE